MGYQIFFDREMENGNVPVVHTGYFVRFFKLKVAVRSANKERQNPIKGKQMHGVRDFCPVFASFVRA
jgi:hypothetical protein